MGRRAANSDDNEDFITPLPATTPEGREQQLIAATFDLVEQRILKGTASAAETTHFLKLGGQFARLELRKLEVEIQYKEASIEQAKKSDRVEELFSDAIKAFRGYAGQEPEEDA